MSAKERQRFVKDLGEIRHHAARCIRCGFCNTVCPTSNVTSAFKESRTSRGRLVLLQSLVEDIGQTNPYSSQFKRLIDLCFACRRCVSACPAGIPIPDLMFHARYAHLRRRAVPPLTLGHRIFANYGTFDRLGSLTAPISNWMLTGRAARRAMEWITHIDARANMPRFQHESFASWFKRQPNKSRSKKIAYFVDSYANYNDPRLGKIVFAILHQLGYSVVLPPQKESAMPAIEYGMLDKARKIATYNVRHLLPYAKEGIRIVCSSPAATYLLREGYATFLDGSDCTTVGESVVDITELMLNEHEKGNLRFEYETSRPAKYHYCCLSKALSHGPITTRLLQQAGIDLEQVDDCCGGAGVWGTFKENYEISSEIAAKLRHKIEPASVVLTESETCRLQIEPYTSSPVRFPLELLAERVSGIRKLH